MTISYLCRSLEETQLLEVEKALVLANQGSAVWRKERVNKVTRGQVVTEDLTRSVTLVCGVILPRRTPRQDEQVRWTSKKQNIKLIKKVRFNIT